MKRSMRVGFIGAAVIAMLAMLSQSPQMPLYNTVRMVARSLEEAMGNIPGIGSTNLPFRLAQNERTSSHSFNEALGRLDPSSNLFLNASTIYGRYQDCIEVASEVSSIFYACEVLPDPLAEQKDLTYEYRATQLVQFSAESIKTAKSPIANIDLNQTSLSDHRATLIASGYTLIDLVRPSTMNQVDVPGLAFQQSEMSGWIGIAVTNDRLYLLLISADSSEALSATLSDR